MWEVTIKEIINEPDSKSVLPIIERYKQTVDVLDLRAVIAAVMKTPRKARTPKEPK